ncbi:hypothetical protein N5P37_000520 [Trichoderma harzianum]|nr:hypothetical protein N5P37_000520 [Trichoderma harzianum]
MNPPSARSVPTRKYWVPFSQIARHRHLRLAIGPTSVRSPPSDLTKGKGRQNKTASQRQALWEWPICSVTPGKRFLSRHVLFWPTTKLATGLAPAGAAGHDTGTRTMQSQHDSCSRLSAAPPGRSSVCLAAGEVARTGTSTSASEAKAICQVKRLQTNVPVQVSSHLITLYHGYGPSMVLRTYEYSTSATRKVKRGRLFLQAAALSLPPTSQARHSPTMVRPARLGRTCLGHLDFARDSTPSAPSGFDLQMGTYDGAQYGLPWPSEICWVASFRKTSLHPPAFRFPPSVFPGEDKALRL